MSNMLNLSKADSEDLLNLRKQNLSLCLEKKNLLNTKARVAVVLDFSGSMNYLYKNGTVQAVMERLLPIAMNFDDNGAMEAWIFEDGFHRLPDINHDNYYGYIKSQILDKRYSMGGTCYAPIMKDVATKYIKEEPQPIADYIIFITDGDCVDGPKSKTMIKALSYTPIFWQFVGIGSAEFSFLETLDSMTDRYVDNANLFVVNNIMDMEDDEIYDKLLAEFPVWLKNSKVQDLISNNYRGLPEADAVLVDQPKEPTEKKGFFSRLFG